MPIPARARAIMDFVAAREAPRGYVDYYRGVSFPPPRPLTEMTIDEVLDWQAAANPPGPGTAAAGRYQIIEQTLRGLKRQMDLTGDERFDPAMQDRMAFELMLGRGWDRFARGTLGARDFALSLAKEWASLPVLDTARGAHRLVHRGQSYYAGDGVNKALADADSFEALLAGTTTEQPKETTMAEKIETPPQTAHKAGAAGIAGVAGGILGTLIGGWLDLDGEATSALTVALGAIFAAAGAFIKRNYLA